MFLKSLTLKGFKSFGEPTTLELEPGVTVVVGPNGSGKSNVVDAVAWVLGAQGPRALRSGKMEDVIFAGTAKRPALGRAEVSLVIDNSARRLPLDLAEITITRTLFRSGDSEYSLNGAECRLLDIQELLSDTGVGRQQHVIVGQGQLDGVLSAQPMDRRLVVEEAAGVLKFRRRRERAERRLAATEVNLVRLQDLLREVRRQLRPLERQAEAARQHAGIAEDLRQARLHLAGREIDELRRRAAAGAARRDDEELGEANLVAELDRLDGELDAGEADRHEGEVERLGDLLARLQRVTERARGLRRLLEERRRGVERDLSTVRDEDLVASLVAEAAEIQGHLTEVAEHLGHLMPEMREVEARQSELNLQLDELEAALASGIESDRAAAGALAQVAALRRGLERDRAELARVDAMVAELAHRRQALEAEELGAGAALQQADTLRSEVDDAVGRAQRERQAAERRLADAEGEMQRTQAEAHRWRARAEALSQASAGTAVEDLDGVGGLVGRLATLVTADHGWERALEALLAEAGGAAVLDGPDGAQAALARLAAGGRRGTVLALGPAGQTRSRVRPPSPPGPGSSWLRDHVRVSPAAGPWAAAAAALVDRLLADTVVVEGSWREGLDVHLDRPDLVVVTRAGDRFSARGWTAGPLDVEVREHALGQAEATARIAQGATTALEVCRHDQSTARVAESDASRRSERAEADRKIAHARRDRAIEELARLASDSASLTAQERELSSRIGRDASHLEEWQHELPGLEADAGKHAERAAAARAAQAELRDRANELGASREELGRRAAALEERGTVLRSRLDEIEERLASEDRETATLRRSVLDDARAAIAGLESLVGERVRRLEGAVARTTRQRRTSAEVVSARTVRLGEMRGRRLEAERELARARERRQRLEIDHAEAKMRLEASLEAVRRDLEAEPDDAVATGAPQLPPGTSVGQRVRELERELRAMGPVNPLALEEMTALTERHQLLESQLEDVRSARRELGKVIRAIDGEILEVFTKAYADVADAFSELFEGLFPGGEGQLRLTDPANLLETGIEIEAKPPGRNVRRLALLSGGERSLVALAFLFAVFRSRPSPFYVLDEVEAALDDVNLHRFLALLDSFRDDAQLIVVSHQKRTMEAADSLFGVTMQPGGSSKIVSERVRQPA